MSQDQIQLPEPECEIATHPSFDGPRPIMYLGYDRLPVGTTLYTAETVRRLIAEAVAAERERATEEANRRANASWSLMAKKMVEAEREACAKICDGMPYRAASAGKAAGAIRARKDQS